ncbi:histamine N-methyltransferase-like [Diadema setosum]|uniref:histamine N-methyltransferase-like n=1 Tax=Diadema setosum TaxID=31175 RepID=UPI003B3B2FD2
MSVVPYILDDLDYYTEAYQTFTRCSAETGAIADWIDTSFQDTVVKKLASRVQTEDGALKVLGIGSGAGNIDCALMEKLLPSFPKIDNTIIEPAAAQTDLFKKLIASKGDALSGVTFEWKQETSDAYLDSLFETQTPPTKYHLIHAVHVLYYATDLEETLKRLYDLLEDGGILFIITLSGKSTINKIHIKMNEICKDVRPLLRTDDQIKSALDSVKLPFQSEMVMRYIQGTAIFEPDSLEGKHLLDFLTHSKDFRETAPDDLCKGILDYLKMPECSEERDGKVWVYRHWVHLTVDKLNT